MSADLGLILLLLGNMDVISLPVWVGCFSVPCQGLSHRITQHREKRVFSLPTFSLGSYSGFLR